MCEIYLQNTIQNLVNKDFFFEIFSLSKVLSLLFPEREILIDYQNFSLKLYLNFHNDIRKIFFVLIYI